MTDLGLKKIDFSQVHYKVVPLDAENLKKIDFSQVHYKVVPLDAEKRQPVTFLNE